jgi:uncharacterized repeat protein (TIGR03803 family)
MSTKWITRAWWVLASAFLFAAATSVGQTFEVVHSFTADEGSDPQAGVSQLSSGDFVGTTVGGFGTLFRMDSQGRLGTVYFFKGSEDGASPHAPLLLGESGDLYGTTMFGLEGYGGVYRLSPSGTLTILKAFVPKPTAGEIEGSLPHAPLVRVSGGRSANGLLYGVTSRGGMDDLGTIFSIDGSANVRTVRHFSGFDGAMPFEALIEHEGFLYGTTTKGGATDGGTIFRIDVGGSNFAVVHNFRISDGIQPEAPLIALNGSLYGTTSSGGRYGLGTVFRVEPAGAGYTVIHHFTGPGGARPHAALVKASDGYLYGTTLAGGPFQTPYGNIFRMNWTGGDFSIVHQFRAYDGAFPQSRLIEASDGALYGTTAQGGADQRGVVFRLVFVPVRALTPSSGPAGGTAVQVTGANFQPGASLSFGGAEAEDVRLKGETMIIARTPALAPGTLADVLVDNLDRTRGGILKGFFADFLDVPRADIFHDYVEKMVRHRITAGIGGGQYGRNLPATNAQMAVFLLKAKHGPFYAPPPATGAIFEDVPADSPFASWIEQLALEGIADTCYSGAMFCPDLATTRGRMARLLLKARHGSAYAPPPCEGIFKDVPCSLELAPWIEQLSREGITGGCDGGWLFCPAAPVTRGQTAVFLTKSFLP